MKKNMFKRAWLNITRKRNKSIVLLIVMFVIANLVLASLAISNSVDESTDYAKEVLGSDVYLNADMEALMGEMQGAGREEGGIDRESISMDRPEINLDMVLDIADSSYVRDLSYSVNVSYEPVNFELIEGDSSNIGDRFGFSIGNRITAYNAFAYIPEVEDNTIEITEGTYFNDTTENGLIISYELAELNELEVGSVLELESSVDGEIYEYEVIGIFLSSSEGLENSIYTNIDSVTDLMDGDIYNNGDFVVSNVVYYLNDPDNVDKFISDSSELYDFEELSLVLDIDSSSYDQMAGPLESVGSFSTTILVVVVLAAILIIALIINNNMKERKYEMGVLMSLGASKMNIIGQLITELVIVVTVGFVLSIGTSSMIASGLSDSLLENQIAMSEESSEANYGRPSMGNMKNPMSNDSDVEVIDEIDVSVSGFEYLSLFGIGYLIALIAMILPAINIMKYEPKTILTGRE